MKKKLKIAIGGSAANPPHLGHKALIEALLKSNKYSKIMWIPSGLRQDKPSFVSPQHRVKMTQLTFNNITDPRFIINLSDVYGKNMPTIKWLNILQEQNPRADLIWYTGIDSVIPLKKFAGLSEIEAKWHRGNELISDYHFTIIPRQGFPRPEQIQIPLKNYEIFDIGLDNISSTEIRNLIAKGDKKFETMVTLQVSEYIKTHKLYGWKGETA